MERDEARGLPPACLFVVGLEAYGLEQIGRPEAVLADLQNARSLLF